MASIIPKYAPIEYLDDTGSEAKLITHCEACETYRLGSYTKSGSTRRRRWLLIHGGAILSYGLIAFLATYYLSTRYHNSQSLIYSPANKAIKYEQKVYNPSLLGDPEYFGVPSAELDHRWNTLLLPNSVHLTEEDRQHYGHDLPIVQLPDGTYFGQLWVYHELHCLKRLYQYINSDHYFPNLTDREHEMNRRHTEHCLGTLRQGIMCHGDVTVMPMVWGKSTPIPLGDFSNSHACVNFDKLHEWALERAFTDGKEPGVLVHPKLGPSFPDGQGSTIGFSDEDIDKDGNIVTDS
ncbi:hypothetical protein F5Y16DRAFT_401681 [Xylariaceae sp. FL0255]|nr:hypothetical protein F5Y16DRAFT_401681 [Xylariaceae sp. FL0255]